MSRPSPWVRAAPLPGTGLFSAGCACRCSSLRRYQAEAARASEQPMLTLNHATGEERVSSDCLTQAGKSLNLKNTPEGCNASRGFECGPVKQRGGLCARSLCHQHQHLADSALPRLRHLFHYSANKSLHPTSQGDDSQTKGKGMAAAPTAAKQRLKSALYSE